MIFLSMSQPKCDPLPLLGFMTVFLVSTAVPAIAKPESAPENQGGTGQPTTSRTVSGGTRSETFLACAAVDPASPAAEFIPLIPNNGTIATQAERVNLYIYIPAGIEQPGRLTVRDRATNAPIFAQPVSTLSGGTIMRFVLPDTVQFNATATPEQAYRWELQVYCDEFDDEKDVIVQGGIHRLPSEGAIAPSSLWHETLEAAYTQRDSHPEQWQQILAAHALAPDSPIQSYIWDANLATDIPTAD